MKHITESCSSGWHDECPGYREGYGVKCECACGHPPLPKKTAVQAPAPEPVELCPRCKSPPPKCNDDFECDCIPMERLEEFENDLTAGAAMHLVREVRRLHEEARVVQERQHQLLALSLKFAEQNTRLHDEIMKGLKL